MCAAATPSPPSTSPGTPPSGPTAPSVTTWSWPPPTPAVRTDAPTVVYCRVGWRSAHSWFVLSELLGLPDIRNYDGAWREFGSLIGAPIVNGPEPWGPDGIPSIVAQRDAASEVRAHA